MSKKSKKKSKSKEEEQPYYELIGETVSPSVAYLQAASLLDLAAVTAVQCGDAKQMGIIAHHWIEMAIVLQGGPKTDQDEEPEEVLTTTKVIGFGTKEMREVAENDARKSANGNTV